jgi:hypothetical protein
MNDDDKNEDKKRLKTTNLLHTPRSIHASFFHPAAAGSVLLMALSESKCIFLSCK